MSEAEKWLKDLTLDHADAEDPVEVGAMSYGLGFMGSSLNGIPNRNMKLSGSAFCCFSDSDFFLNDLVTS